MSATETATPTTCSIVLDAEEMATLRNLLNRALGEVRVEAHRTHTPDYRADVLREETLIRRIIEKLPASTT